jgi:hypothetical protein
MATEQDRAVNKAAVSLHAAIQVVYETWPDIEQDPEMRRMAYNAGNCLVGLAAGDPTTAKRGYDAVCSIAGPGGLPSGLDLDGGNGGLS